MNNKAFYLQHAIVQLKAAAMYDLDKSPAGIIIGIAARDIKKGDLLFAEDIQLTTTSDD